MKNMIKNKKIGIIMKNMNKHEKYGKNTSN